MKKIIFSVMLAFASVAAFSQKGTWYIGGVVGFGSSSTTLTSSGTKTSTSSWAGAPEGGTFLKDDIQLGLALGLTGANSYAGDSRTSSSYSFNPTLYSRKFFKVTDNFSFFTGLYLTYIKGSTTNYVSSGFTSDQSGFGARLGVGVAYGISPRFTAVGQYGLMGYSSVTNKVNGTETSTDKNFDIGVNSVGSNTLTQGNGSGAVFNIGLYYTFITK
jgi:hypothetical protein